MEQRFTDNPSAHDQWVRGNRFFDRGEMDGAMECFRRAVALDPSFAEAYNSMGIVHYERRSYREALESYKQAVLLKPHFAEALSNLGAAFLFLRRFQDAATAYRKVIEIHPEMAEAHNNLALVYEQMHRTEDALRHYRRFIELWDGSRRYRLAAQERIDRLEQGRKSGVGDPLNTV